MTRGLTLAIALCLVVGFTGAVHANSLIPGAGGARFHVKVKSLVDMRFKKVVRQQYDLSCGAAAMATLLKYFYGDDTDERQIIDGILEFGDQEKIKKDGFSMLELKKFGEREGYVGQGYRIEQADALARVQIPVLTLVNTRGYNHFVVIPWMNAHPSDDARSARIRTTATGEALLLVVVIAVTAFLVGASSQP